MISTDFREALQTDLSIWEIGPYHGALPAPMRLKLKLDGEVISSCEVETGFLHRGLEKAMEAQFWPAIVPYADHLDPEAAAFGELAVCLAAEEIGAYEVPPRAQSIRVILCELTRLSTHVAYIVRMARAVGAETMVHYGLRDRERLLDLFELLTGGRFALNFLKLGGVRADVTDGFVERVLETAEMIRIRLREYNDLFTFNHSFLKRTSEVAPASGELARELGVTGPNARASGLAIDVRKDHPYSGYDKLDFSVPLGQGEGGILGDSHDRFVLRLREIQQCGDILKQVCEALPSGEYSNPDAEGATPPKGEAYVRIESPRGLLGCHMVSDGKAKPSRIQFRPPSQAHLSLIPRLVAGIRIEDLPVMLASLDLGIAEADR